MRRKVPPFIVFNGAGADGGGSKIVANPDEFLPGDADLSDTDFLAKRGFPRGVKKDDMEPEQRESYWRYESKKQQHRADAAIRENGEWEKLGKRDDLKTLIDSQEDARRKNLDDNQRAVEDARNEGRTAAQAEAQAKFLAPAIEGQVLGLTRTPGESVEHATARVKGALEFVDVTKFLNDDGNLDAEKVQTFAQSIAPKDGNDSDNNSDLLFQSLSREQLPAPGAAGSVAQYEQQVFDRLNPSNK